MHLFVIPLWFSSVVFAALLALALWRGGAPERAVAIAQTLEILTDRIVCHPESCQLSPHWLWATIPLWRPAFDDGFVLVVCLVCAARVDRYWCIWACAFALLGEISDLSAFAGATRWAWLSASLFWTYAIGAAVLWGVLTRRAAAVGGDTARAPGVDDLLGSESG